MTSPTAPTRACSARPRCRQVLAKLNEAMVKVLTDPATVKRFADLTAEASPSTPQELAACSTRRTRTVVPLLKKLGVKPE